MSIEQRRALQSAIEDKGDVPLLEEIERRKAAEESPKPLAPAAETRDRSPSRAPSPNRKSGMTTRTSLEMLTLLGKGFHQLRSNWQIDVMRAKIAQQHHLKTAIFAMKAALLPAPNAMSCFLEWTTAMRREMLQNGREANIRLASDLESSVRVAQAEHQRAWVQYREAQIQTAAKIMRLWAQPLGPRRGAPLVLPGGIRVEGRGLVGRALSVWWEQCAFERGSLMARQNTSMQRRDTGLILLRMALAHTSKHALCLLLRFWFSSAVEERRSAHRESISTLEQELSSERSSSELLRKISGSVILRNCLRWLKSPSEKAILGEILRQWWYNWGRFAHMLATEVRFLRTTVLELQNERQSHLAMIDELQSPPADRGVPSAGDLFALSPSLNTDVETIGAALHQKWATSVAPLGPDEATDLRARMQRLSNEIYTKMETYVETSSSLIHHMAKDVDKKNRNQR